MTHSTDDYRAAPAGDGPLATAWNDKPHRLVYDLCRDVDALRRQRDELLAACKAMLEADIYADGEGICYFERTDTEDGVRAVKMARAAIRNAETAP